MEKQQINPWTWQERFGFSHAWRVEGAQTVIFLAGQGPVSADGEVLGVGDFEAQARHTFENLRTVLEEAGASFDAVVKVTVYLTDMSKLRDLAQIRNEFINLAQPPASTAIEVTSLALPGMMVEIEAIAVI